MAIEKQKIFYGDSEKSRHFLQKPAGLNRGCIVAEAGPQSAGFQRSGTFMGQWGTVKSCPEGDTHVPQLLGHLLAVPGG